ncbi:50S ribosomal protein L44e [Candidatus Micrarchaeota archaeon]|nr:50S ribosomal protein L44e [Candidatus Micrarchaeota archaeon]
MKVPKEIRTYCPHCRKHNLHKVKVSTSKYKAGRSLAWGTRKHERKLAGYHGKVKGKAKVRKQGIRNKIMLQCSGCKKKHETVVSGRMKKKAEVARE